MKYTREKQLEEESKAELRLLLRGLIIRDKESDVGIDMEIEFVKGQEVENKMLWVQIKATESTRLSNESLAYSMETKHLVYYENAQLPVIIVLWVKPEKTFYYLFAQKYIREELSLKDPNWRNQKTKTIVFPRASKLSDKISLRSLATEGYFYIIQQQLNAKVNGEAFYWLDGIPRSDNEELKDCILKALSFMTKKKFAEAITEFERIQKICVIPPTQNMSILISLGNAYFSFGQNNKALKNLRAAIEITRKVNESEATVGKCTALSNIGIINAAKGDLNSALKYFGEVLKISREQDYIQFESISLSNIGMALQSQGKFDQALESLKEALKIDQAIGQKLGESADLLNLGVIYRMMFDVKNALECFTRGLEINREIENRSGEGLAMLNMGLVNLDMGEFDLAMRNYENAAKIFQELGDRKQEALALDNIGLAYGMVNDFIKAINYHESTLKIFREIGYKQGEANTLGNLALDYFDSGRKMDALRSSIEALVIIDKNNLVIKRTVLLLTLNNLISEIKQ